MELFELFTALKNELLTIDEVEYLYRRGYVLSNCLLKTNNDKS